MTHSTESQQQSSPSASPRDVDLPARAEMRKCRHNSTLPRAKICKFHPTPSTGVPAIFMPSVMPLVWYANFTLRGRCGWEALFVAREISKWKKCGPEVLSDGWVVDLPIGDLGWKIRWIRFFPLESRLYLHTFAIAAPLFRPGQCSSAGCSCDGHCMCFVGLAHFFTVPCSSVCEFLFTSINIAHVPSNSTKGPNNPTPPPLLLLHRRSLLLLLRLLLVPLPGRTFTNKETTTTKWRASKHRSKDLPSR